MASAVGKDAVWERRITAQNLGLWSEAMPSVAGSVTRVSHSKAAPVSKAETKHPTMGLASGTAELLPGTADSLVACL